jgi:uncharacterized membrane protein YcaP (DUF421 family)
MWMPELSVLEKIVRAAAVYFFLLLGLRLTGKRQMGQLSSFDLVVLLIISNVLQNAMIGNDNSVLGGFIGAATILLLNYGLTRLAFSRKAVARLVEGSPTLLIHNGKVLVQNLRRELLTHDDLMAALRRQGILTVEEVHVALMEETGAITAVRKERSAVSNQPSAPETPQPSGK